MKIFLFDELGQLLKWFPTSAECAVAIGCTNSAVRTARRKGYCLLARYYVSYDSKMPHILVQNFDHNAALNFSTGSHFTQAKELGTIQLISQEQVIGLELLAQNDFCFDWYLFGNTALVREFAESLFPPDRAK